MDPTHMAEQKAGWPARTYIQQPCEDMGCSLKDLPEAMNDREKCRERVKDNPCYQHDMKMMMTLILRKTIKIQSEHHLPKAHQVFISSRWFKSWSHDLWEPSPQMAPASLLKRGKGRVYWPATEVPFEGGLPQEPNIFCNGYIWILICA